MLSSFSEIQHFFMFSLGQLASAYIVYRPASTACYLGKTIG